MMSSLRTTVVAPFVITAALLAVSVVGSGTERDTQASAQKSVDYEAIKTSYRQYGQRIETIKSSLYLILCSAFAEAEYDARFWSILVDNELPHRAFRQLQERFPEQIANAFGDREDLIFRRGNRLHLKRDAMSAWVRIQAEQILS